MILEQAVINLVDVRKVVNRITGGVLIVQAHLVMENCMEANVFEICDRLHVAQIASIAIAQAQDRAPRSEHLLPKMRKGMRRAVDIYFDGFWGGRILGSGNGGMQQCEDHDKQRNAEIKTLHEVFLDHSFAKEVPSALSVK